MYIKTATFLTKKKPPNSRLKSRECGGNYSRNPATNANDYVVFV